MTRNPCTCDFPTTIRCPECRELVGIDNQHEIVTHRKIHKLQNPNGPGYLLVFLSCPASGASVKFKPE